MSNSSVYNKKTKHAAFNIFSLALSTDNHSSKWFETSVHSYIKELNWELLNKRLTVQGVLTIISSFPHQGNPSTPGSWRTVRMWLTSQR